MLIDGISRLARSGALLCCLACALFAAGCGTRSATTGELGDVAARDDLDYVPADDGIPLSSVELAALNSTGELDQNLSREAMDDITIQYKYFLHKARPTFERFVRRAELYLPYAKQVFRERGLPEELAYLAMIESGYNPIVVSRAGAAGTWQFMPFTGQKYGLAQDWWMDERHDPYKATYAAADYLAKLHGDFKDWRLAVAAYNAGEGKIGRALEGTGAKEFFELTRLNHKLDEKAQLKDETKQYVPRFLAVCKLMRNLDKLGFVPPDPAAARKVVKLEAKPGTDLVAVARAADMDWAEFSAQNPAFKRHVSPIDRSCSVYVPEHAGEKAALCLADPSMRSSGGWKTYTASRGDTWQRISAAQGVPVGVLKKVNDGKALKAGATLRIPGGGPSPAAVQIAQATPASVKKKQDDTPPVSLVGKTRNASVAVAERTEAKKPAPAVSSSNSNKDSVHVVKPGETVYAISRIYGTDVDSLLRANKIASAKDLQVGQRLRVAGASSIAADVSTPKAAPRAEKTTLVADAGGKGKTYRVQQGDTMWSIARKHNVAPQNLMRLNNMGASDTLRPGDTVKIEAR